jgi:acylphosphatase
MQVFFSGRVQGVGFRARCREVSHGFQVVGTVRNESDGRVQMIAEGTLAELVAFRDAIIASMRPLVKDHQTTFNEPEGKFEDFRIVA